MYGCYAVLHHQILRNTVENTPPPGAEALWLLVTSLSRVHHGVDNPVPTTFSSLIFPNSKILPVILIPFFWTHSGPHFLNHLQFFASTIMLLRINDFLVHLILWSQPRSNNDTSSLLLILRNLSEAFPYWAGDGQFDAPWRNHFLNSFRPFTLPRYQG